MLLMTKDDELFLYPDYFLSMMINRGYELIKHCSVGKYVRVHSGRKGKTLEDFINNQKHLLKRLDDEYNRKREKRLKAITELEEILCQGKKALKK